MSRSLPSPTLADRLQREWLTGGPLSTALWPLSALYRAILAVRQAFYRLGLLRVETLPVPVIVVGNWIVGGAGKTPTTLALLALLQSRGIRAGVVSRGYGRDTSGVNVVSRHSTAREVGDEPLLIHLRAGVPVAVGSDRVAAANALLAHAPDLQVLLSDDGLQHWRLPRALSLLVFDERGLGNGRVLPAGPLRQPPAPPSAESLVVYNAPTATTPWPGFRARRALRGAVSLMGWWQGQPATLEALLALRGKHGLIAAAGVARPHRFFDMLADLGLTVQPLPLPDHADFGTLPWPSDAAAVLVTEKDAVKLTPQAAGDTPVWVVTLDFEIGDGFAAALDAHLTSLSLLP
ncbi:tetraacyldisaccharide 4'-kinase [Roseateles sp. BYS87W]|uniref:Tetraacyldisaccharide 4'-kinase n=1 Tax=Pelomonas baiyunensis TaxID=3299026 RepID=A0ABW7GVY0_9BURK